MAIKRKSESALPESLALEPEKQKEFNKKVKTHKAQYDVGLKPDRGVIYLGHIPHGFYENEMRKFFAQFGTVTRLKLARSKKTGHSKGYAFIEFDDVEVAEIAADTMNNYLMFERLLKCQILPQEKVHPELFSGSHRQFSEPKSSAISIERHNSVKSELKEKKLKEKTISKQKKTLSKLAALGITLQVNNILVKSPGTNKIITTENKMDKKLTPAKKTVAKKTVPDKISTPEGDLMVLMEDESETEISFKTPPNSIRSSKVTASGKRKKSDADTPRTSKLSKKQTIEPVELSLETSPVAKTSRNVKKTDKEKSKTPVKAKDNPRPATPATKKVKKESTPVSSAERPRRMATRSSAKKVKKVTPSSLRRKQ